MCYYSNFEVDEFTGEALSASKMGEIHCKKIQFLQATAFAHFQDTLNNLAMATISSIEDRTSLSKYLSKLSDENLVDLAIRCCLLPQAYASGIINREFVLEVILEYFEKRQSQIDQINSEPIFPNEVFSFIFISL